MDRERIAYRCSFCNKHHDQVHHLFAGPGGVLICDEYVMLSSELVTAARRADKRTKEPLQARLRFWRR